jgi:hypothetical protein
MYENNNRYNAQEIAFQYIYFLYTKPHVNKYEYFSSYHNSKQKQKKYLQ